MTPSSWGRESDWSDALCVFVLSRFLGFWKPSADVIMNFQCKKTALSLSAECSYAAKNYSVKLMHCPRCKGEGAGKYLAGIGACNGHAVLRVGQ